MATIDWPDALIPQTAQLVLRKSGASFTSPFNGTHQALDFVAERWALSCSLAQMALRNPRGVGAFCNRLSGGVERVRVWPFQAGGVPRGTARGAMVLAGAVARGDRVLSISGAVGRNLLTGGSFELDGNADGLADGWVAIQGGSLSGVVYGRTPTVPEAGAFEQGVDATFGTVDSYVGIERTVPLPAGAGTYTVRYRVRGGGEAQTQRVRIEPRDVGGVIIGGELTPVSTGLPGSVTVYSGTFIAPAGTTQCTVRLEMVAANTGTVAAIRWDAVAIMAGDVGSSAYPPAATLLADDFVGSGGQLFQVAQDVTFSDYGTAAVPVVNRARSIMAAGTPVSWYRPTCEMVMPAMESGPVYRPGVIESAGLDLVEVW